VVDIKSCFDDVFAEYQRDRIRILPALFFRKRSRIKISGFAEVNAACDTNRRWLSVWTRERLPGRGRLAEREFVVAAELAAQLVDQP
jgi:hypothetical protein